MFHACPEIHGHCSKLYLHRKIFHSIQTVHRHTYDHMIASVSVWFRISDIITFPDHDQITLAFQKLCQIIDIIYKIADHPDTCNILKIILRIHHSRFFSLSLQFLFNTLFLLNPALDVVDRSCRCVTVQVVIQHIKTCEKHLFSIFIWLYKFIIFFICHIISPVKTSAVILLPFIFLILYFFAELIFFSTFVLQNNHFSPLRLHHTKEMCLISVPILIIL